MDNKLSELSKPVAYDYQIAGACIADGHNENGKWVDWNNKFSRYCPPDWMVEEGKVTELKPLYSQEYVSALLAELEAKDDALREIAFRVSAGGYNADSVDAEMFKQKIIDGINSISDVHIKRIAELEAIKAAAEKLVRCKGRYHSEQNYRALAALFGVTTPDLPPVDGDTEAVIAELRAKLATPVRLPNKNDDEFWFDGVFQVAKFDRAVERAIRAAGFKFVGDE